MTTTQILVTACIAVVTLTVNAIVGITVKHSTSIDDAYAKLRRAGFVIWNGFCVAVALALLLYYGIFSTEPLTRRDVFTTVFYACALTAAALMYLIRRVIELLDRMVKAMVEHAAKQNEVNTAHVGLTGRIVSALEKKPQLKADNPPVE